MKNVLVTIGLPFYNCEAYLGFTIQSVLNQSYSNWELILLDDGSTDHSVDIARSYVDKRIRVISDGKNQGLPVRLNQLSGMAGGEFYARMDADDIMHYQRIEKQVEYLLSNEVDIVGSSTYSIDTKNNIVGISMANACPNKLKYVFSQRTFSHPSIMGKTKWFIEHPYNEKLRRIQDFDLWLRTIRTSLFANIPEPLLFYREISKPELGKYLSSQHYFRSYLFSKDCISISFYRKYFFYAKSLLKSLVYRVLTPIGLMDRITAKRHSGLSLSTLIQAEADLHRSLCFEETKISKK